MIRGRAVAAALAVLILAGCAAAVPEAPARTPVESAASREFDDVQQRIGCTFREGVGYFDVETSDSVSGACPFGDTTVTVTVFTTENAYANAVAAQPSDGAYVSFYEHRYEFSSPSATAIRLIESQYSRW